MTLRTVLLSLQALLAAAEPDDPQDAVVANQVGANMHLIFFFIFTQSGVCVYRGGCQPSLNLFQQTF